MRSRKGAAVIGGNVGGIRGQITDGEDEDRVLVDSVEQAAERIVQLQTGPRQRILAGVRNLQAVGRIINDAGRTAPIFCDRGVPGRSARATVARGCPGRDRPSHCRLRRSGGRVIERQVTYRDYTICFHRTLVGWICQIRKQDSLAFAERKVVCATLEDGVLILLARARARIDAEAS